MAISELQRRSICRIYVPGTTARGTGFLVESRDKEQFVLTAAHVVQASQNDVKSKYAGADIELEFGNPGGQPIAIRGASVQRFDSQVDAALLKLPVAAPAGSLPFTLAVRPLGYLVPWQTYGYTDASEVGGKLGSEYGGDIRTTDPQRFQLRIETNWGSPAGLSGAPCIVNNQVCAMVLRAPTVSTTETVFARCIGLIAATLTELTLVPVVYAYVPDVTLLIQGLAPVLVKTAVQLKLAANDHEVRTTIVASDLPERVAQAMMAGPQRALDGVANLKGVLMRGQDDGLSIVTYATRTWIDDEAVQKLAATLQEGKQIIVINTASSEIAGWYVHRAGFSIQTAPGAFEYAIPLAVESLDATKLMNEFENAIAGEFGCAPTELASYLANVHDKRAPIVVWLAGVPERAAIDKIRAAYGAVRIILLVGPEIPERIRSEYADALIIEPHLVAERGDRAIEESIQALNELHKIFTPRKTGGKK